MVTKKVDIKLINELVNTIGKNWSEGDDGLISIKTRAYLSGLERKGIPFSDQHKKNISISNLGKKNTPEQLERMANKLRGRKLSAEHIEKVKKALTGRKATATQKAALLKGHKSLLGKPLTAERKNKLSNTLKKKYAEVKRVNEPLTAEHKLNISLALTGRKHSEETIKKMSESQKGKLTSAETKAKISATLKAKPMTEKRALQIELMHSARRGSKDTEETKAKRSEAMKKVSADPEYRIKMSESQTGRVHSEETKAKLSEAAKRREAAKKISRLNLKE